MRTAIYEFLDYSDAEKKDLWDQATFVFDTNVYLNLYRYTEKTRSLLLGALNELRERLWMPNHVAHEFMKNRNIVIWETNHRYSDLHSGAEKFIESCRTSLNLDPSDGDLNELKKLLNDWIETAKEKNILVTNSHEDKILDQLLSLYDGKVGPQFSEDELKTLEQDGKTRYAAEIPPGYKDSGKQKGDNQNNTYGDYMVWKQILNYAASSKKDIILVTNDQKEDWWETLHNQTIGPRIELRKEFFENTSQRFHMYTMKNFITHFENGVDGKVDRETIDEIDFFSKIIHHRSNRQDLKEYYKSFESDSEARAAKIRFSIMRLENKNRKRLNVINHNRDKYAIEEMPKEIESMVNNTIAKLERDTLHIQKLKNELTRLSI